MTLDEQKEIVAKQACRYSARLLESNNVKTEDVLKAMQFLSAGIESAEQEEDLRKLKDDLKTTLPSLSAFETGI